MIARRLVVVSLAVGCSAPARTPVADPPANIAAPHPSSDPHTVADVPGVIRLALDEHHVYFMTSDVLGEGPPILGRVARTGGVAETIATTPLGSEVAVTPGFVWWNEGAEVVRAAKGSTKVERLPVAYARVHHLASSGDDVWISAGGDGTTERLLVFENESTRAREVLDFATHDPPYSFAAAEGQLAVSGAWMAYSVVRDGKLVHLETDRAGSPVAVAGDRMVTAGIWIKSYPLDGGAPRVVSDMRALWMAAGGCGSIMGGAPYVEKVHVMSNLAGGGGRIAITSGDAELTRNRECRAYAEPNKILDGTAQIALIDVTGTIEAVAIGEDETLALAVDAHGVVWSTRTSLRAVDR